jgi:hypothetical protein
MSDLTVETMDSATGSASEPAVAGEAEAAVQETETGPSERLVPVSESIRYRRRAQAAEQQLTDLQRQLGEASQALQETREQLEAAERRQRIDQLLIESEAIDLEAARLLTEAAVSQMDEADVADAVAELRQRKPYLFRNRRSVGGMGARGTGGTHLQLDEAARQASFSGDRRDLLRYLRMRRGNGRN